MVTNQLINLALARRGGSLLCARLKRDRQGFNL